jgi:hypothetical protein
LTANTVKAVHKDTAKHQRMRERIFLNTIPS